MSTASIALVAGEASGDLVGRGFESYYSMEKLSVRGYVEVLRHYREIMGIRRDLLARLLDERPQLFIGIDAPDFNLDLEYRLKAAGVPTMHYVSPSIWAWRRSRLRRIARSVSHMLVL